MGEIVLHDLKSSTLVQLIKSVIYQLDRSLKVTLKVDGSCTTSILVHIGLSLRRFAAAGFICLGE